MTEERIDKMVQKNTEASLLKVKQLTNLRNTLLHHIAKGEQNATTNHARSSRSLAR